MKKACAAVLIVIAILAVVLSTQCGKPSYTVMSLNEMVKMPPFKAEVEGFLIQGKVHTNLSPIAFVGLKTEVGKRITLYAENPSPELLEIIQSLNQGQTYTFPAAFLEYTNSKAEKK